MNTLNPPACAIVVAFLVCHPEGICFCRCHGSFFYRHPDPEFVEGEWGRIPVFAVVLPFIIKPTGLCIRVEGSISASRTVAIQLFSLTI